MKTARLTILFLLSPLAFFAQTLTGLWIGSLNNDSVTVRKDQSFEIVLTQYKNKVYGYSRSTFIVNDTLFYIVKRVKGTIEGDICEVKDDNVVAYNFPGRLDKGVRMVSLFRLDHSDSTWKMDGEWKTNKTKKYYSVSGQMALKEEKDYEQSKIFPHLEELKLADDVAFYKESKKPQESLIAANPSPTETKKEQVVQIKQPAKDNKKDSPALVQAKEALSKDKKKEPAVAVKGEITAMVPPKNINPEAERIPPKQQLQTPAPEITNLTEQKKETVVKPGNTETKKQEVAIGGDMTTGKGKQLIAMENAGAPKTIVTGAAALVSQRKVAPPQIVNFNSDSLELALYDNGEVDGDTVSVLLNGEIILAKQGLKASAIKKTIYVPPGTNDSLTLVLYAENLGKYPPNTGLLIVHDGDDVYQVRFSADLQQNASVIFKRKQK